MKNIIRHIFLILPFVFSTLAVNAQCFDDGHSPFKNQGWLSCESSVGPIPDRGDAHWILYDFGEVYPIDSLYFWNHNVWGETGMGVKEILIDYSEDQESWTTVGPIEISKAPGSWKYTGDKGPSLNNADMRYVLVTVISTWDEGSGCAGLAEMKFNIGESVSVENVVEATSKISPNPAYNMIDIQIEEYDEVLSIQVYNSIGQLISSLPQPSGPKMRFPVSELQDGLYYLTVRSSGGINSESFVKVSGG